MPLPGGRPTGGRSHGRTDSLRTSWRHLRHRRRHRQLQRPAAENPKIVDANPELHEWHTVTYHTRMPGLKWGRTLWVAMKAGGPFQYTGLEMRDAHWDLKISPEVFDEVTQELINAMDDFKVPEREKADVLAAFGAEKGEVTAGSQPGAVNWRRWR